MLGVIGAFSPLLPTVPLVLLAAFCFARSAEALHSWLIDHRYFGAIVRNFEAGQGVPESVKLSAIVIIWISIGISCWSVAQVYPGALLFAIGVSVSIYLWQLPAYAS
ncbi:MAG: YbaN family protein [Gammaproteobacteria bacterium]|nr:YbaN family protein [Gammaproteobacteria bacterium]